MLNYSIGEVESLVLKAFRGAGFDWGVAEEAGQAAGWMAMHGLPVIEEFALLLPAINTMPHQQLSPLNHTDPKWHGRANMLCPVHSGIVLSDGGGASIGAQGVTLQNVLQPLILLPFAARREYALSVAFDNKEYLCAVEASQVVGDQPMSDNNPLCCDVFVRQFTDNQPHENSGKKLSAEYRAYVTEGSVAVLNKFANNTYVPASASSRNAGAGAGLLDND